MVNVIISFSHVLLFCFSARMLIQSMTVPMDISRRQMYSVRALRIEKNYKLTAWSILTLALLILMVSSFMQTFNEMN